MVNFRFFTAAAALPALMILSACANGSSAVPQVSQLAPSLSDGHSLALPDRSFPVANQPAKSVTFFGAHANGDVAPVATISGDNTGLRSPDFLAKGRDGRLFVTDTDSVRVFAAGANGNVAPIQVISGAHTELDETHGIALRGTRIYVASHRGDASRISIFSTGSNGDVAPIRTIKGSNTGLDAPRGVAVDTRGYIYVSNITPGTITVYAPNADGNVAPIRTISGSNTQLQGGNGIAVDSNRRIYTVAANDDPKVSEVLVFPPGANGDVSPAQVIGGEKTHLDSPAGIAVSANDIYVTNYSGGSNSVVVYSKDANGDVAPKRMIVGQNTGLHSPVGILAPY